MSDVQYLDYEGLLRYHELIDGKKADKTEISDVVRYSSLSLTTELKTQARTNIGAGTLSSHASRKLTVTNGTASAVNLGIEITYVESVAGANSGSTGDITATTTRKKITVPAIPSSLPANGGTAENVSGTVAIANGGTGATTASGARTNLGLGTLATKNSLSKSDVGLGNVTNESKATMFTNAALTGTPTAPTASAGTNTTQIATTEFVLTAISGITDAMVFIGTVGKATNGSGTVSAVPTSNVKVGHTYKIVDENKTIAAANSATGSSVTAKIGDTIVATDTTPKWIVIPSGDEPSGTVTSVKILATSPIAIDSDAAITSSGTRTITHATSGATAGSYGPTANATASHNTKIKVPQITVDTYGHVTSVVEREITALNTSDTNQKVKAGDITFGNNDVINFVADSNVTVTGNSTNKTITIGATDTTYKFTIGSTTLGDTTNGTSLGTLKSETATANGETLSLVKTGEKYTWNGKQNQVAKLGSTTKPVYTSAAGTFAECSTYAGGTKVTLNGSSKAASDASFYAPTSTGTSGQVLIWPSSGTTPGWGSISIPTISYGTLGSTTLDNTKDIDKLFITT